MNVKKEIVEEIIKRVEEKGIFKKIYKNIIPIWTNIQQFPAFAILYEKEKKERHNLTNRKAYFIGEISIFIFNKQPQNKYDDILSDLIEEVYSVIEDIRWENFNIVDATLSEMKREGGIVHPYAIATITVQIRYIKSI
jgi:hypothetical protein